MVSTGLMWTKGVDVIKPTLYSENIDKVLFSEYVCYHPPKGWGFDRQTGYWVSSCCGKPSEANAVRYCQCCEYYFVDPNKKYPQEYFSTCSTCRKDFGPND